MQPGRNRDATDFQGFENLGFHRLETVDKIFTSRGRRSITLDRRVRFDALPEKIFAGSPRPNLILSSLRRSEPEPIIPPGMHLGAL